MHGFGMADGTRWKNIPHTYHRCDDQGEHDYDDQQRNQNATPVALTRTGGDQLRNERNAHILYVVLDSAKTDTTTFA